MAIEPVQKGFASDGNGIAIWCPAIADPSAPTVAEITDPVAIRLTYGLTPDGFQHTVTENSITSGRYTLRQVIELAGTVQDNLELTYVYNRETPTAVETALGTPGTSGFVVHILGYPNDHVLAAADVINAVIPCDTGIARDNPPAANTEPTKTVKMYVTGEVRREVAIAAA